MQTAGRGRFGRSWHSGKENLTFSFLYIPTLAGQLAPLSIYAGLALRKTLSEISREKTLLKWPNDVTYQGKKLAGILSELVTKDEKSVIIFGVGVNLNADNPPAELKNQMTSLKDICNKTFSPEPVLSSVMYQMKEYLTGALLPLPDNVVAEYNENLDHEANLLSIHSGDGLKKERLEIIGINKDGQLRVKKSEGSIQIIDAFEAGYD